MPPLKVLGYSKPIAMKTLAHMLNITLEQADNILIEIYGFSK